MSKPDDLFEGVIGTNRPHEVAERLAEEFHKDMKSCRIFKSEKDAQVHGGFKKRMETREIIERIQKAMED